MHEQLPLCTHVAHHSNTKAQPINTMRTHTHTYTDASNNHASGAKRMQSRARSDPAGSCHSQALYTPATQLQCSLVPTRLLHGTACEHNQSPCTHHLIMCSHTSSPRGWKYTSEQKTILHGCKKHLAHPSRRKKIACDTCYNSTLL